MSTPPIQNVSLDLIHHDRTRMHRVEITDDSVRDLAASFRAVGQLCPVIVRADCDGFLLVAGARRLHAARRIEWDTISAYVLPDKPHSNWQIKCAENLERTQLSPYEEALAIADAINNEGLSADDIADRLHRSKDWLFARLAILDWPAPLQQAVHYSKISLAAARPLAVIPDDGDQEFLIDQAIKSGATATTTSAWLQECRARADSRAAGGTPEPIADLATAQATYKLACYACNRDFPTHDLTRLPVCRDCLQLLRTTIGRT